MISRRWAIIGIIGAIALAELVFIALIEIGKLDLFGVNKKNKEQVIKNYLGIDGLPSNEVATDLGAKWTRVFLSWKEIDENGWDEFSQKIDQLGGTQLVATILADNPKEIICTQGAGSCPIAEIVRYEEFVRIASRQYAGKIKFWQIEDEVFSPKSTWQGSVEQYQKVLETAYKILKNASKDNQIILGGINLKNLSVNQPTNDLQIIEGNLAKVFANPEFFDIVDTRFFDTIASISARIKWLDKKMRAFNFQKPIWSLGISGPDLSSGAYSEDTQAEEIAKRMLTGFEAGAEKLFYFRYQSLDTGQSDPLSATLGLVETGGKQKKPFKAYKFMSEKISGFSSLKNLNLTGGATGYQLSFNDRKPLFVIWASAPLVVKLPQEILPIVKEYDYLGNPIAIAERNVNISSQPIFIEIE